MRTAWIDSDDDHDGRERKSPAKSAAMALILFLALVAAIAGLYWLIDRPSPNPDPVANEVVDPGAPVTPVPDTPRPAADEELLKTPPPTCIDGRPANARVPAGHCT